MKNKMVKIELIFDNKKDAEHFVGWYLDGGGEQESGLISILDESDLSSSPKKIQLRRSDEI